MATYEKEDDEVAQIANLQGQNYDTNVDPAEARFMTERGNKLASCITGGLF